MPERLIAQGFRVLFQFYKFQLERSFGKQPRIAQCTIENTIIEKIVLNPPKMSNEYFNICIFTIV